MAFFGWVKRLLGRILGEKSAALCNVCGRSVRPSDLEEGAAVIIARHAYCPRCVEKIVREKKGGRSLPADTMSSHTTTIVV